MSKAVHITSEALQLGSAGNEMLEHVGVIKKSISPWASPIVVVPKKSAPGEAPRRRCAWISGKSMNSSQKHKG